MYEDVPKDIYQEETAVSNDVSTTHNSVDEDFDLPDIDEEEIPDFLKGEKVEKF